MPTFSFSYTLKPRLKCVKKFINDFFRNFIPLFNYGFFRKFENDYPSASVYILLQESSDLKIYWIQIWTIPWRVMGLQKSKFLFSTFQGWY